MDHSHTAAPGDGARDAHLRLALEAGRMGAWSIDLASGRVAWSESHLALHGNRETDGERTIDLAIEDVHSDDRERVAQALAAACAGERDLDVEYRLVWPDGSIHWINARGRLVRDGEGRPVRLAGVSMEITERRAFEESLRASEAKHRFLADMLPQLVWIADASGSHEYFNDRWFEYTGTTLEQTRGEGWTHLLHPDDRERTIATWKRSLNTGEPYEIEYRFRRASDDAYRWFLGRALPMRDESGAILKWFGTCTDIHATKRREAIQRMLADVGAVLASSDEVEAAMREVGRIVVGSFADLFAIDLFEANDARRVATAHARRDKVALAASTSVPFVAHATSPEPQLLEQVDAAMLDRLALDDTHRDALRELFVGSILRVALVARGRTIGAITAVVEPPRRFDAKDLAAAVELAGRCAVALDTAALDRDAAAAHTRYRELAEELERRVDARTVELADANAQLSDANARLLEVDRMKDDFLGGLSTQLSAPLNAILAFVEVLGSGAVGGLRDEQLEYLGRIRASSSVLLASVDDLLDLSRLSAKRFALERDSVDVGALASSVLDLLAPLAKMQGLAILRSFDEAIDRLEADEGRLRQVIVQLVHGAIRLTPSGGFVRIALRRAGDAIRFEAFQTGAPISDADASKVFESVAQLGGAWIGLAVAKRLVEAHGGAIGLEAADDGNSFWFTIPVGASATA